MAKIKTVNGTKEHKVVSESAWMAARKADRVLKRADTIICVSQAAVSTLCLPPGFYGKIAQVYPGIDMRRIPSNGSRAATRNGSSAGDRR